MTFKELNSLYDKKKIISRYRCRLRELKQQLQQLNLSIDGVGGLDYSGMPKAHSTHSSVENAAMRKISIESEIEYYEDVLLAEEIEYSNLKIELEKLIFTCEDLHIRCLLQYRFVDLLSWQNIALKVGGNNTADAVRKACNRYIKKSCEKK